MGANISTVKKDFDNTVNNSMETGCSANSSLAQVISGVRINNIKGCDINVTNEGRTFSNCNINAVSDALAKYTATMSADQRAGLGLNLSTDIENNKSILNNYFATKCGSSSSIDQTIKDVNIEGVSNCGAINIMNRGDAQANCIVAATSKLTSLLETSSIINQVGLNPMASLGSCFFCLIVLVGAYFAARCFILQIAIILLGIFLIFSGGSMWNKAEKDKKSTALGTFVVSAGVINLIGGGVWLAYKYMNKHRLCMADLQKTASAYADEYASLLESPPSQRGSGRRKK